MGNMVSMVLGLVIGLYTIAQGIAALINKGNDRSGRKLMEKYTEESVRKFLPVGGIISIILGIFVILVELSMGNIIRIPFLDNGIVIIVLIVIFVILYLGIYFGMLKKK